VETFFFRLTNWALVMTVGSALGAALAYLVARFVFKRRVSYLKCLGALVSGNLFSMASNFGLVLACSATNTFIDTAIIVIISISAGLLGMAWVLGRCKDSGGVRLGFVRGLATLVLAVVVPVAAVVAGKFLLS